MARARDAGPALIVSREAERREIIAWYRDRLAVEVPPQGLQWEPVKIGPTWQWSPESGWALPERTLGWDLLAWTGMWLRGSRGPWAWTPEQARFLLWFYALDEHGDFEDHSAVLQRLKGWGKDPLAAGVSTAECFAPVRFDGWDSNGDPIGREEPNAWVQVVAVSQEQTKNTMKLLPGLIPAETRLYYGIQIGKVSLWGMGDTRQIEAVTSSPLALEGGRPTLVVRNETQNWNSSNGGHDMVGVLEGNAAKAELTRPARMLDICNAFRPGEDSVAERVRDAWEGTQGDAEADDEHDRPRFMEFGLLYDSLEAPPEAPLTAEAAPSVVEAVRGDAEWLDAKGRILKSILNPVNPPSESRRKWYNQVTAAEDAWTTPQAWDALRDESKPLTPGEEIVLFLDGSKSDDATGLVACRVLDGHVATLGMWQRPPGDRGKGWTAPRPAIDTRVRQAFDTYRVSAFFADPSHVLDDETHERYWDALIDGWHRDLGKKLRLKATASGQRPHSIMWDMSSPARTAEFVAAAETTLHEIEDRAFTHDGDPRMRTHVGNARRYPTKHGLSIAKEHRESRKKIDLAVCMIGARMVRRAYLNSKPARGGRLV